MGQLTRGSGSQAHGGVQKNHLLQRVGALGWALLVHHSQNGELARSVGPGCRRVDGQPGVAESQREVWKARGGGGGQGPCGNCPAGSKERRRGRYHGAWVFARPG